MKKGINYDTGFLPEPDRSRRHFDRDTARRELRVIAEELHCRAVRVSGGDPARLAVAAAEAAAAGLEVWYAPFPVDVTPADTLPMLARCAADAEKLRAGGAEVVLVTGCEASAFLPGFMPGETYGERLGALTTAPPEWWQREIPPIVERLDSYLTEVARTVRPLFGGRITYAAAPWEYVDWTPFDVAGLDAYRAAYNAEGFREELRARSAGGKPLAVTEFGTCAYQGAGDHGGSAYLVPGGAVPDEEEQVRYLNELLDLFEEEGVETALWFTFAGYTRTGAADLGSYGVVRMLDETRWEPKAAFHAMAARYARS